jgi:hypothetical protein
LSIGKGRGIWSFEAFLCWTILQHTARPAHYDEEMTFFIFFKIMRCIGDVERKKTLKKQMPSTQTCKRVFSQKRPKNSKENFYKHESKIRKHF